jgi:hypothetical protein
MTKQLFRMTLRAIAFLATSLPTSAAANRAGGTLREREASVRRRERIRLLNLVWLEVAPMESI